ncbi:MAG TPA: hypothetical protein VFB60_25345 [Ktedonobacteraceae bacterium]|nr:hypothetical protein [Ktedonobacteraceae bacterium]
MTLGFLKRCLFIPNGSHASRSGEEGARRRRAHAWHLPLPVSAFGASSQSLRRRLQRPAHDLNKSTITVVQHI